VLVLVDQRPYRVRHEWTTATAVRVVRQRAGRAQAAGDPASSADTARGSPSTGTAGLLNAPT